MVASAMDQALGARNVAVVSVVGVLDGGGVDDDDADNDDERDDVDDLDGPAAPMAAGTSTTLVIALRVSTHVRPSGAGVCVTAVTFCSDAQGAGVVLKAPTAFLCVGAARPLPAKVALVLPSSARTTQKVNTTESLCEF